MGFSRPSRKTCIAPGSSKSHFQGGYIPVISEDDTDTGSISGSEPQGCLPSSDESQAGCSTKHPAYRQATILTIGVVVSCSLVALVLTIFALSFNIRTQNSAVTTSPCGSTAQEARARGCHFDVISFCWLPDACYDEELSTTFDNITTWEWFLDPNRTQPIAHEEAMTGEYTGLYVNWEYHLRHCTFMWKKLHRAVLGTGKSAIDGYIGPLAHTEHCSEMLLQDRDVGFDAINTIILVKFPDCGIA